MYERVVTQNATTPPIQMMTATMTITAGSSALQTPVAAKSTDLQDSAVEVAAVSSMDVNSVEVGSMEVKFSTPGAEHPSASNKKED